MKHPLALVFMLALVLRVGWALTLDEKLMWSDEQEFAQIARHLVAGDGFVSTSYRAAPIVPTYLALVFRLFGENYLAARIGQAIAGALTCVLVGAAGAILLGEAVGVLSGVLLSVYLPHIYLSGVFYVECWFTLLIALTVYLSVRSLEERRNLAWGALAGVALGLTALTRSIILVYLPFLCLALLYSAPQRRGRQAAVCAVLVLATVATVTPWAVRNYTVFGKVLLITSGFGTKLWQGNNEMATGDAFDRDLFWNNDIWARRVSAIDERESQALARRYAEVGRRIDEYEARTGDRYLATDSVLGPIAWEYMLANPGRTVRLFFAKLGTLFSPFSETISTNEDVSPRNRILVAVVYWPMLVLAVAGAWLGLRRERALSILYLLILSVAAAYGMLNTCTRFRLPLDPYLIVFASLACVDLWQRRPTREPARQGRPVGGVAA